MLADSGGTRAVHSTPVAYSSNHPGKPSFISGIDESMAEKIRGILSTCKFVASPQPVQRLRMDLAGDIRVDVSASEQSAARVEQKSRICRTDLGIPSSFYDIRIDAAVEEDVVPNMVDAGFIWHTERQKRRTSFVSCHPSFWRVDLTEVQTIRNGSDESASDIELEFEMLNGPMVSWLLCSEEKVVEETVKIVKELCGLLRVLIPGHRETFSSPRATAKPDVRTKDAVKDRVRALRNGQGFDFLGSMPVNLTRRNFSFVRQNNYFITEKSDGLRYLLFVVNGGAEGSHDRPEPVAVLMDRSGAIVFMEGAAKIGAALGVGTVLDGELVFNLSLKENVFLVFDVLSLDWSSKVNLAFRNRIELVRTDVMPRCNKYITESWKMRGNISSPTILIRKDFLPKCDIAILLSKIVEEDGAKIFFDPMSGGRRHHRSDGIILQPAELPYVFGTDTNLLKWKWPELISVDLAVILNSDLNPRLLANGPDSIFVDCAKYTKGSLTIGKFDAMRLRGDMQAINRYQKGPCIAEFAYDTTVGLWTYFHIREDKTVPNHISTVLSVLMEQAESVSIDELHFRLLARFDAENDYQTQLKAKMKELLDFQVERTRS